MVDTVPQNCHNSILTCNNHAQTSYYNLGIISCNTAYEKEAKLNYLCITFVENMCKSGKTANRGCLRIFEGTRGVKLWNIISWKDFDKKISKGD